MWNPVAGNKIELRLYCWHAGAAQLAINTLRMIIDVVGPGPSSLRSDDLCDALSTYFSTAYKAVLDSSCTYAGASLQLFPQRSFVSDWSKEGAGAGTVVGNDCPTQASGLITLRTNYAKRTGRGRVYIPFPSVTSNDTNGLPTAGYMTNLQTLANLMEGPVPVLVGPDLLAVTLSPVICNAQDTGILKPITDSIAVQKWATQRRRGSYGRVNSLPPLLA